jgi:PIN domain nuclease of toxin-antitoxin system
VNILLDTHAMLWFLEGDHQRLSEKSKNAIEAKVNSKFVSIASLWEISIKINIGKLKLQNDLDGLQRLINSNGFKILSIQLTHLKTNLKLELRHRDPFDRLIISQAATEDFHVVTKDPNFSLYPIKTIW